MKLVVGLGNPGPEHSRQRHNVGFMAAEAIAGRYRLPPWRRKFRGEFTEGLVGASRAFARFWNDGFLGIDGNWPFAVNMMRGSSAKFRV